jgi:phospholipid/cholesterol/gamma-HCH transport system substrate-binding protein
MKNTLETRLGIFVALAVIATVLILETVGGLPLLRGGYHLQAFFDNVQDLKIGDRVKMAGIDVGRVQNAVLDANVNKVKVTMRIETGVRVKSDSVATVKFTGLMGQNFVSLTFGSPGAPLLGEGAKVNTSEQPDLSGMVEKINDVAKGVDRLTASFTGVKVDELLGPLTTLIKDSRVPLTMTISNIEAATSEIARGTGTVHQLIYANTLYNSALATVTNLDDTASQLKLTLADAREVVDQVKSRQGTVGKLIYDDALYASLSSSATNLNEILQKINRGNGTVSKLINEQEFYQNAKMTLQKLDKATEGLEDQGPLSVMGIVVGKLF